MIIDISCLEKLIIGKYSMKGNELLMQSNNPLSGLELDMEQLRMLAIRQGALHRVSTAVLVNMPDVKKAIDQQLLSDDDRNEPGFKAERDEYHIIHGSFRDLVSVYVDDAGDLGKTKAIGNARTEQEKEEITTTTHVIPEEQYSVLKVVNPENDHETCEKIRGFFGNNELRSTLRMIIFTKASLSGTTELQLTDMEELERVIIGDKCFLGVTAFHVQYCPKLRRVFIGDGSFTICTKCVIEDNEELLELQFGSTAASEKENKDDEVEENKDDEVEEEPTCFQCSTLKLASCFSSPQRNE